MGIRGASGKSPPSSIRAKVCDRLRDHLGARTRASAGLPTYIFPPSKVMPFAPCAIGARTDPVFIVERPMRADRSPSTQPSSMQIGCDRQDCT